MSKRERLIAILNQAHQEYYAKMDLSKTYTEALADSLIANEVRVTTANEPKSNGDRIREMSDEELARFIGYNSLCDQIQNDHGAWCKKQRECKGCLVEWLKLPAKEEE